MEVSCLGLISNFIEVFKIGSSSSTPDYGSGSDALSKSEPLNGPKSVVEDPIAILQSLGYKDKPLSLTYDTLKRISIRNSVISSIISTRVNQVSTFSQPARFTKDKVGFEIVLRDPNASPTKEQKALMLAIESFIENCGFSYDSGRDNFDTFLRKVTRDSLVYDQLCFEVVPDRMGRPAEIYTVDASTIRAAVAEPGTDDIDGMLRERTNSQKYDWVQVVNGEVVSSFTSQELAFCVRNPRSDINIQPYGFSELEILVNQITSHLWAEEYNSKYFSQGGTTKGILNLKGSNISKEQLDAFRRQWTAQVSGLTGAWKTPIVSVEGLEYLSVSQSNREMEYEQWMNYLINICCAVYQIDPAEINFPNRGGAGGAGGAMMEGGLESRIKNSRDKGLRPLLRFLEASINKNIIHRFSRDFNFVFIGLDKESEEERAQLYEKLVRTRKTINEIRAENDDPPIEGGEIILDPTYTNYLLQKKQNDMMAQQQQQGSPDDQQAEAQAPSPDEAQQQQQDQQISQGLEDNYQVT